MLIDAVFCVLPMLTELCLCVRERASVDKINLRADARFFLNSIPAAPVWDDESCWSARRMIYDAQIEYIITHTQTECVLIYNLHCSLVCFGAAIAHIHRDRNMDGRWRN